MFPKYLSHITYSNFLRGGVTKKNWKIWEKFPIRLDPPPPRIIQNILNFRNY